MTVSFVGTAYHGFQRQKNALAVQNVIEDALTAILGQQTLIVGCSRTDTGVHAREFCLSFRTSCSIPCEGLVKAMNGMLPGDIAVRDCCDADDGFHARYSCIGKEYEYLIYTGPTRDPFWHDRALYYPYSFRTDTVRYAASFFEGRHDFTSFCGADGLKEDNCRTVTATSVTKSDDMISVRISADGFLYNMVRIIVGTLIDVNEGRKAPDSIPVIIDGRDRSLAGATAPSHGLYLNRVFYP